MLWQDLDSKGKPFIEYGTGILFRTLDLSSHNLWFPSEVMQADAQVQIDSLSR